MCDAMKKHVVHFEWKIGPGCPVSGIQPYVSKNPERVNCETCLRLLIKEEKRKAEENRTWSVKMHLSDHGKPLCGQKIIYPNLTMSAGRVTCERCLEAHKNILEEKKLDRRQSRSPVQERIDSLPELFKKMRRRIKYLENELKRHTDNVEESDF